MVRNNARDSTRTKNTNDTNDNAAVASNAIAPLDVVASGEKRKRARENFVIPVCKCIGCQGCNLLDAANNSNPLPSGHAANCANMPQRYINKDRKGRIQEGYRQFCKPCLRRRERIRMAEGTSTRTKAQKSPSGPTVTDRRAHRQRIVLFGDSLTERAFEVGGFGAKVQDTFRRFADVACRGYSGYNTNHALCVLNDVFPKQDSHPPVLVTVLFGSNDACEIRSHAGKVQHVPLQRYESNLQQIVEHLRALSPAPRILFITPPPVHDVNWLEDCKKRAESDPELNKLLGDSAPNRTNAGVFKYVKAMQNVATKYKIPCVDVHPYLAPSGFVDETQFVDGLHLSEAGQRQCASLIIESIARYFPDFYQDATAATKGDYPDWKTLTADAFETQIKNHAKFKL